MWNCDQYIETDSFERIDESYETGSDRMLDYLYEIKEGPENERGGQGVQSENPLFQSMCDITRMHAQNLKHKGL